MSQKYEVSYYFFLSDSNKITALGIAICFFLFFKNIKMKCTSWINRVAASNFGVLCIYAVSDEMCKWLWKDCFKNVAFFNTPYLVMHVLCAVAIVFVVCTIIDQMRIKFIEKPFF